MNQKGSNVLSTEISPTSQVRQSGRSREDGQKEDRMWHLPPLQMAGLGQGLKGFQNVFKGERAESWIEELELETKEGKVFKFTL